MARLKESSCRRPTFREGVAVVLADGQTWQLRRPMVRFVPSDNEAGYETCLDLDGFDGFGDLLESYEQLMGGSGTITVSEAARRELALGRAILVANYDLTLRQVGQLLKFSYDEDDVEGSRIRSDVLAVATGNDPKRSAAGDGSSVSPADESPSPMDSGLPTTLTPST